MRELVNQICEGVIVVCMILVLFFGTGLDDEGYTCLIICGITCIPLIISTVIYNLTKREERR